MATATLTLGPRDHGRALTLTEFDEADFEEGYLYELGRGVLEVTKVPGTRHRQVISNLLDCIAAWKRLHPGIILGYGGGNEFQFLIPGFASGRNPDLAVVFRPDPASGDRNPHPSLAAEVVSRRSVHRDYVLKREEYLAYGLAEYWIIDFLLRKLTLLTREGDAWAERVIADDSAAIPSVVLPGLGSILSDLWADLDFYEADADDDEAINPEE